RQGGEPGGRHVARAALERPRQRQCDVRLVVGVVGAVDRGIRGRGLGAERGAHRGGDARAQGRDQVDHRHGAMPHPPLAVEDGDLLAVSVEGPMVKLIFCCRRLEHLSRAEFQRYWRGRPPPPPPPPSGAPRVRRPAPPPTPPAPRRSGERHARREPRRPRGVRRHRGAVVGQRGGPRRGARHSRGPGGGTGAARGRAPLHRPCALAPLARRGAPDRGGVMPAPVRLIVNSDYLCPWCYLAAVRLHRVAEEFGDRVVIEWRSYLLRPYPDATRTLEKFRAYTRSWERPAAEPDAPVFRVWESDAGP